jgi:hypothetical protein
MSDIKCKGVSRRHPHSAVDTFRLLAQLNVAFSLG